MSLHRRRGGFSIAAADRLDNRGVLVHRSGQSSLNPGHLKHRSDWSSRSSVTKRTRSELRLASATVTWKLRSSVTQSSASG